MLQQIRRYLHQQPFAPFSIHCSNGDVFQVNDPQTAAVQQNFVTIALPDGLSVASVNEHFIVCVIGSAPLGTMSRTSLNVNPIPTPPRRTVRPRQDIRTDHEPAPTPTSRRTGDLSLFVNEVF